MSGHHSTFDMNCSVSEDALVYIAGSSHLLDIASSNYNIPAP